MKALRIGIVCWVFPKLSETFVLNQISYLLKRGHKVRIYATKDPRRVPAKEDLETERIIHPLARRLGLLEKTLYVIPSKMSDLLRTEVRKKKLDLIYFQFPDLASRVLSLGELRIPVITAVHDLPKYSSGLKKRCWPAFANSELVLPISEFAASELQRLGCPHEKVFLHRMGVDQRIFAPAKTVSRKLKHIALVGRFVPKKGFSVALRALALVRTKHPDLKVRLIGGGYLRPSLEKLVGGLHLDNIVEFTGKKSQTEIARMLRHADLFICPSLTTDEGKREGLPVVLIEAAAAGIPIIASKHAAIPELGLLTEGITLVREGSVTGLAAAIERAYRIYPTLRKKSMRDRENVLNVHGLPRVGKNLEKALARAREIYEIRIVLDEFAARLTSEFGARIASCFIVGSLARNEDLSTRSDLDLIIVWHSQVGVPAKSIQKIATLIRKIEERIAIRTTTQLFNEFDFFELVSPALLKGYSQDGKLLAGRDILADGNKPTLRDLELAILKRMLFQRYDIRQRALSGSSDLYHLSKIAVFLAKYLIWLSKRVYPTEKKEVLKYWRNLHIAPALQIPAETEMDAKVEGRLLDFIETIVDRAIHLIRKRYPSAHVKSF